MQDSNDVMARVNKGGFVFELPEVEDKSQEVWNTRELTIFIIDCTENMFQTIGNDNSYFKLCLKCCRAVFMSKIIGSSNDLLGIVFYGTKENDPGDKNPKHIVTFFEPQQPNADIIKQFDKFIKSPNACDFATKYGHFDDYSLADVLWHASSLINKCKLKISTKKLILMTCNDNPHRNDTQKQYHIRKKAEDIESLDIEFDVIPLGQNFAGDVFYDEIMQIINGSEAKVQEGLSRIEELLERTYRKDYKKRSVAKLKFNLGQNVTLGVEMFNFYRSLKIPSVMKLDKRTNEPVKSVMETYHAETGERFLKSDLNKYVQVGNKDIYFDSEELENLHMGCTPSITLLGFKPLIYLSPEYHFRPSSFIYPNDETIKGSTLLFTALLKQCLRKQKFALCYMVSRQKGKPWLVALVPQEERTKEVQVMPAGFHVIYLPYAENIREIPLPKQTEVTPEQVELCAKILKKVSFKYNPSIFENPQVQTHWANIEALALNDCKVRDVTDETLRDYNEISNRLGNLEVNFVDTFYVDDYDPEASMGKKRRYPASATLNNRNKIPKIDPCDPEYVEKMTRAGFAEKLTVEVLKKYLSERNVNVKGFKKSDLLNCLYEMLNINRD